MTSQARASRVRAGSILFVWCVGARVRVAAEPTQMSELVELAGILWALAPDSVPPAPDDGLVWPAVFVWGGHYEELHQLLSGYRGKLGTAWDVRQFFKKTGHVELAQFMCHPVRQVNGVAQVRANLRTVVKLDARTFDDWHSLDFFHTFMLFILVKAGYLTVDDVFRVARREFGCTSILVAEWLARMSKLGRLVPGAQDKFEMTRSCIPGLEDAGMEYLVRQLMAQGLYADAEDRTLMQVAMGEYLVRPMMRALRGDVDRGNVDRGNVDRGNDLLDIFLCKPRPVSRDVWWNTLVWLVHDDVLDLDYPDDLNFSRGCTECVLMMDRGAFVVEALIDSEKLEFLIEPGGLVSPSRAVWILLAYQSVEIVIALCDKYDELMGILHFQWPLLQENSPLRTFDWDEGVRIVQPNRKERFMFGGDDEDPDEE